MPLTRYFLLMAALVIGSPTFAQSSQPVSLQSERGTADVDLLQLPGFDNEALLDRDETDRVFDDGVKPLRFAEPYDLSLTTAERGTWEEIDGYQVWRLIVDSPDAFSLNFGFSSFELPEGASLWMYGEGEALSFRGITSADNNEAGEFWSPVVIGERAVIELNLPLGVTDFELELGHVGHAYRPFGIEGADMSVGRSGACNVDVECPEGDEYRDIIPAIGVYTRGGVWACSGSAINNTAHDGTPYFLTANHCGISGGNASSVVVYWNFENSFCRPVGGSGGVGDGSLTQFNSGSMLRGNSTVADWALIEFTNEINPEYQVALAGWDRRDQITSSSVAIHHPRTNEKRISFDDDPTQITNYLSSTPSSTGTHLHVSFWNLGTTEGGSSGSPLLSPEKRIVGQLHGGYASCSSITSDWYGRVHTSMNGGMAQWLDPLNSGIEFIDALGAEPPIFAPEMEGGAGNALYLDGNTSFVSEPSNRIPTAPAVTVAAWLMAEEPGTLLSIKVDDDTNFEVGVTEQDGDLFISYGHDGQSSGTVQHVFTDQPLGADRHQVVITRGGTPAGVRLFIDGFRVGSPFFYTEAPVTEGERTIEMGTDFQGTLDEVRLHDTQHSQSRLREQISQSFATGEGPSDLVAYFRFDADSTGFAYDFAGNFLHGDISSDTRVASPFPVGEEAVTMDSGTTGAVGEPGMALGVTTTEPLGGGRLLTLYQVNPSDNVVTADEDDLPEDVLWRSETVWGVFYVGEVTAALDLDVADLGPVDGQDANAVLYRAAPDLAWTEVTNQWTANGTTFQITDVSEFGEWSVAHNPIVSTDDGTETVVFDLSPAYPNPFTERATLTLTLPAAENVSVEVVDLLGRRVALVHDGMTSAGTLSIEIDGSRLAPGTYLVRAAGEQTSIVQRVTLVR